MDQNDMILRKDEIRKVIMDVSFCPVLIEQEDDMTDCIKLPLSRITAFGTAFEPLVAAVQNVINGGESASGFYRVTVPEGTHLAQFKGKAGNLGTVLNANNQIAGQATLTPLICDPTMIFMAATLVNIDKKLDKIQEIQQEMLDFLVQKEKSELRGDLKFLEEILNNYKYNWNNEKYKSGNYLKVLDIRQAGERKIDFYQAQITNKINKKSVIHSDQNVKKQLDQIQAEFQEYQFALYIYSFASFLEVMLLENFDSEYLNNIANRIETYSLKYRDLYTKCYNQVESYSKSSIQSHLLKGLASVNRVTGETIAKIPVISKSQLDEGLVQVGNRLSEIGEMRTFQTMKKLVDLQSALVRPFIENINTVNKLYNQPIELFFDKENIYLGAEQDLCF